MNKVLCTTSEKTNKSILFFFPFVPFIPYRKGIRGWILPIHAKLFQDSSLAFCRRHLWTWVRIKIQDNEKS